MTHDQHHLSEVPAAKASDTASGRLRIAVGIATVGRPAILVETVQELQRQTRAPDRVIISATFPGDVFGLDVDGTPATVLFGAPGLPRQRNRILAAAQDCDVVLFIDDDFMAGRCYLAETERAFAHDPRLVVTTGTVLADGIGGRGLTPQEGWAILATDVGPAPDEAPVPAFCGYGCNMAVRMSVVRHHGIRVDETLPLYAWQEDVDFTRRLARHGKIVRLPGARGVHLGTKSGRGSGLRLGYSQIANPIYLAISSRGRDYPYGYAAIRIARNLTANAVKVLAPEPWIDRKGRLKGNLFAVLDALRGRLRPERVLEL